MNQITSRRANTSIRCCCRERTWWRAAARWSSPPSAWTPRPASSSRFSARPSTNRNKPSKRWRRVSCPADLCVSYFYTVFARNFRIYDLFPLPPCYHWVSLTFLLVFIASHQVFPFVFILSSKIGMTSKNVNCKLTNKKLSTFCCHLLHSNWSNRKRNLKIGCSWEDFCPPEIDLISYTLLHREWLAGRGADAGETAWYRKCMSRSCLKLKLKWSRSWGKVGASQDEAEVKSELCNSKLKHRRRSSVDLCKTMVDCKCLWCDLRVECTRRFLNCKESFDWYKNHFLYKIKFEQSFELNFHSILSKYRLQPRSMSFKCEVHC